MIKKSNATFKDQTVKFIKKSLRLFKKLTVRQKSKEEIHRYWEQPDDNMNLPEQYSKVEGDDLSISRSKRSKFLVKIIKEYSNPSASILEIGPSVGRNLNYLFLEGYEKLTGVEISKNAIESMKKIYPEMAKKAKIINKSVEDVTNNFKKDEFDIIFTMAVLEHIHPDSEFLFSEMVRITSNYIITIEDEKEVDWRHFPRNYKKIFEPLGMKQIYQHNCTGYEVEGLNPNFKVRVFKK